MFASSDRLWLLSACLWLMAVWAAPLSAQPSKISWQGLLTDTNGSALNGTVDLSFSLYDVADGGTAVWTMDTLGLPIQNGLASLSLGPFAGIDFGEPLWLGVTVNTDSEISPRSRLNSSPTALTLVAPATINGNDADNQRGVLAVSNAASSNVAIGVSAATAADSGRAVRGIVTATSGRNYGVWGASLSPSGRGVTGNATSATGQARGVVGLSRSNEGSGLFGNAQSTTGVNYGVRGVTNSPDGYSGYFTGGRGVYVDTVLTAGQVHAATDGVMFPDSTIQKSARLFPVAAGVVETSTSLAHAPEIYTSTGNVSWVRDGPLGPEWHIHITDVYYIQNDFVTIVSAHTADSAATRYPRFASDPYGHLVVSLVDSSGAFAEGILSFVVAKP